MGKRKLRNKITFGNGELDVQKWKAAMLSNLWAWEKNLRKGYIEDNCKFHCLVGTIG